MSLSNTSKQTIIRAPGSPNPAATNITLAPSVMTVDPNSSAIRPHRQEFASRPLPAPSPLRRHYLEAEEIYDRRGQHIKEDDGPPGPSSETVLTGIGPRGPGSLPPRPTSTLSHHSAEGTQRRPPPSQLMELEASAKVLPARVRASPELGAPTPTEEVAGSAFEAEVLKIGRLNKVMPGQRFNNPSPYGLAADRELPKRSSSSLSNTSVSVQATVNNSRTLPPLGHTGGRSSPFLKGAAKTAEDSAYTASVYTGLASPLPEETESEAFDPSAFYEAEAPPNEEDEHPNRTATAKPLYVPYAPDLRPQVTGIRTQTPRKPLVLRDYQFIAEACARAGRVRMEGFAYYKIGDLLSKNTRDTLHKAIPYFKKYLNISRRLGDVQGEGKALNTLGNTYYQLQNHQSAMKAPPEALLESALQYHKEHATIADAAGLFIANSNMGLCHRCLGDTAAAAECYKAALQLAVRAGDKAAEALALANLAEVGAAQGDIQTAQVCVDRNLEIAAATSDSKVGCESYAQLGALSMQRGEYTAATEAYLHALDSALSEGDTEKANELRVEIGLVQGMLRMEGQMRLLGQRMSSGAQPNSSNDKTAKR